MFACNFRDALTFSGADGNWAEHSMDMAVYPGRTLAYVAEDFSLVIVEPDFFSFLFAKYTDET